MGRWEGGQAASCWLLGTVFFFPFPWQKHKQPPPKKTHTRANDGVRFLSSFFCLHSTTYWLWGKSKRSSCASLAISSSVRGRRSISRSKCFLRCTASSSS